MTAKTCSKCRFWKRGGGDVGTGVCVRFMRHQGASDTCPDWEARK